MSIAVTDTFGKPFELVGPAQRIISLIPSITEIFFSLGVGDRVVGVTKFCTQPPDGVKSKPKVGGQKNPRVDAIIDLKPDLVVANVEENRKEDVEAMSPERIVVSPGPCTPREAGLSNDVIRAYAGKLPILGVCLGHQCIGHVFGAVVAGAGEIMHGKTSVIHHDGKGVFKGLPEPFEAIRYHSLAIQPNTVPDCLEVTARTDKGVIMGVRHKEYLIEGVQFHPESIMTKVGKDLLRNFLRMG